VQPVGPREVPAGADRPPSRGGKRRARHTTLPSLKLIVLSIIVRTARPLVAPLFRRVRCGRGGHAAAVSAHLGASSAAGWGSGYRWRSWVGSPSGRFPRAGGRGRCRLVEV